MIGPGSDKNTLQHCIAIGDRLQAGISESQMCAPTGQWTMHPFISSVTLHSQLIESRIRLLMMVASILPVMYHVNS